MKAVINKWYTNIYPTDKEVNDLCKPGSGADTCSWLCMGANGWICCCLNKPQSIIDRRKNKEMIAMRDGCNKVSSFSPMEHKLGEVIF